MLDRAAEAWRRRALLLLVVCTAVLITLAMLVTTGCGSAEQSQSKQEGQAEQPESGENEVTTSPAPTPTGGGTTEGGGTSTMGGNTQFSLDMQEIGRGDSIADLKITDIRWADHGDYFRIVFEVKHADGSDVTTIPDCDTWYPDQYYGLAISINNIPTYKFDYAPFKDEEVPVSLGDPLVEYMKRLSTADTEPVYFEVVCSHSDAHPGVSSRPHRLMYETNPMRIILDIQKM